LYNETTAPVPELAAPENMTIAFRKRAKLPIDPEAKISIIYTIYLVMTTETGVTDA